MVIETRFNDKEELLTIDQMCEIFKVDPSWFYKETRRKKSPDTIPVVRIGKYLRFRLSEVMAWLEARNTIE
ncbi:MAG: helix-turn-helix domain-containing protein [bacterium]|nr:MAG: helix-turn-helix domain-containing protein [bacterium]